MKLVVTITLIAVLAVVCLSAGTAQAGSLNYKVTVDPGFAISGDNVTIKVFGPPNKYASIDIVSSENETVKSTYVFTNSLGGGSVNWTVPVTLDSGMYSVMAKFPGNVTEVVTLEVVHDKNIEQDTAIAKMQKDLDLTKGRLADAQLRIASLEDGMGTVIGITGIGMVCCLVAVLYVSAKFKDLWELKAVRQARQSKMKGLVKNVLHMYARDRIDRWIDYVGPNLEKAHRDHKAARLGMVNVTPSLVLPKEGGIDVLSVSAESESVAPKPCPPGMLRRVIRRLLR